MSILKPNGVQAANTAKYPDPKILFVPNHLYQALTLKDEPVSSLTSLDKMLTLFGVNETATFIYINSLYNPTTSFFKKNEVIDGFQLFDLIDKYRDDLKGRSDLESPYDAMIAKTEGLKITGNKLPDQYIYDMGGSSADKAQYYVPEMFVLSERIYGVRLKAITGDDNVDEKLALKEATVANVGLLSNSYDIRQLATFDLFKKYIALCP